MPTVYSGKAKYPQYTADACSLAVSRFDALEKAAKVSYRCIRLADLLISVSAPLKMVFSQLKDLVLIIESTRFFPVSYPVFIAGEDGKRFCQIKSRVQNLERISLVVHLAFKMVNTLNRLDLVKLGKIGTYAIGYLPVFTWILELSIISYNFFGAIEGAIFFRSTADKIKLCQNKIDKWNVRGHTPDYDQNRVTEKLRKWETIQSNLQIDRTKAWLKIAATTTKFALIAFAVSLAASNLAFFWAEVVIVSLGIISDSFGLTRIFYNEYKVYSV